MQNTNNIIEDNYGYEIPSLENTKKLLIMLHGYLSNGDDMIEITKLFSKLKDTYFVSLNAIKKDTQDSSRYYWFDLQDKIDEKIITEELQKSQNKIYDLIDFKYNQILNKIKKEKNFSNNNEEIETMLLGFSQGAITALDIACFSNIPITKVVAFSGIFSHIKEKTNILKEKKIKPQICLIHGKEDDVISYKYCEDAYRKLKRLNLTVEQHLINALGHSIDLKGIKIAENFLN